LPDRNLFCEECNRLWGEYAEATNADLKVMSNQQIASIRQDSSALATLDVLQREAGDRRERARRAIKDHERKVHSKAAGA
jgi:5-methylthioribose kinase